MASWLKKLFPPTDYQQRYADMSDRDLAAIGIGNLNDVAKKCYEQEISFRKQYAAMSDEEFSTIDAGQLTDVSHGCYQREATFRSKTGDCLVRVVSGVQVDIDYFESRLADKRQSITVAPVEWPSYCARCDSPGVSHHLDLVARFRVGSGQFSIGLAGPICAPCHQSRDTQFLFLRSSDGRKGSSPAALNPGSLLGQASDSVQVHVEEPIDALLLNGGAMVTHVVEFANYAYGARFKAANSPTFPCATCNQGVGNPYKRCSHCGAVRPVGAFYFSSLRTFAAYICGGCGREVSDDSKRCPWCRLRQPSRCIPSA